MPKLKGVSTIADYLRELTDQQLKNVLKAANELELESAFITLIPPQHQTLINEGNVGMSKQLLVTKTAGNTQYQLYRVRIPYPATYNNYRGTVIQQDVNIDAYGIVTFTFIEQEQIYYDTGPLSAHSYQVSALFHLLHRRGMDTIDEIRTEIWTEQKRWCWNKHGNPFGHVANQKLRKQVRKLLH